MHGKEKRQPEAVAGPTPFRALSAAMAACTSGRKRNAFLEHSWTASSPLEATSCCSFGLNFPLCGDADDTSGTFQQSAYWGVCRGIRGALTVSFHSISFTSSNRVRCFSDRLEISAGSSSWYLITDKDSSGSASFNQTLKTEKKTV